MILANSCKNTFYGKFQINWKFPAFFIRILN